MLLLAVFIILPVISFVLGSAAILVYIFWPSDYSRMTMPSINLAARHIVVIAHGLNDRPSSWSNNMRHSLKKKLSQELEESQVIALNWNPYSTNAFRCSVDGKRIGAALGAQMAQSTQLKSVHLIAHSCGSFVILGLCETLKAKRSDIMVQTTYLAPVGIYGGISWNYGNNYFGSCADFSDAYIDRDDPIGFNKELPPNTYSSDVTDMRKGTRIAVPPHVWPTVYYQQLVDSGDYPDLHNKR